MANDNWQIETAERLASIERSIKYIEVNLSNLPPSSVCLANQTKLESRVQVLEDFKKDLLVRISWVSGAFAVVTSGFFAAFDSIKDFLFRAH